MIIVASLLFGEYKKHVRNSSGLPFIILQITTHAKLLFGNGLSDKAC